MSHLLDAETNDKNGSTWGQHWLSGDSRLIIVAGRYAIVAEHRQTQDSLLCSAVLYKAQNPSTKLI